MTNNDEVEILVYFMQIRDKESNHYLGRDDIKKLFSEINALPYDRTDPDSRVKKIGNRFCSIDIENFKEEEKFVTFFAGKERDANLPQKREESGKIDKIPINPTDNIVEFSCGCLFFEDKIVEGAVLLLQKNYFGCSAIKMREYLEQLESKRYDVFLTVLAEKPSFINLIKNLEELRYIELSEVELNPIGFGDHHRLAKTDEKIKSMKIKKLRIDVRDDEATPIDILKKTLRFLGVTEFNEERLRDFISEHGLRLIAVKVPQTKQEELDLTKELVLFSYETEPKREFDKQEFYTQCKWEYTQNNEQIIDFIRKIIQNYSKSIRANK